MAWSSGMTGTSSSASPATWSAAVLGSDPFEDAGKAAPVDGLAAESFSAEPLVGRDRRRLPDTPAVDPRGPHRARSPQWPDLVDELGPWVVQLDADGRASVSTGDTDVAGARWVEQAFGGGLDRVDVDLCVTEETGVTTTVVLPAPPTT